MDASALYKLPPEYDTTIRSVALSFIRALIGGHGFVGSQKLKYAQLYNWYFMERAGQAVKNPVNMLLSLTKGAERWREKVFSVFEEHNREDDDAFVALILELLLCIGYAPSCDTEKHDMVGVGYEHPVKMSLLHLLASGGCHPDRWFDVPRPLCVELQRRLLTLSVLDGANVELQDATHGSTPLGWACWFGCVEGARALLALGANKYAVDRYGSTPYENMASRHGISLDELEQKGHVSALRLPAALAPFPLGGDDKQLTSWAHKHDERDRLIIEHMKRLRALHAGWAEADARAAAAWGARMASRVCEHFTSSMLPGPALQAVGDALMSFDVWSHRGRAFTRPVVAEM